MVARISNLKVTFLAAIALSILGLVVAGSSRSQAQGRVDVPLPDEAGVLEGYILPRELAQSDSTINIHEVRVVKLRRATDNDMSLLMRFQALEEVHINYSPAITDAALRTISTLPSIRTLNIHCVPENCKLSAKGLESLHLMKLSTLGLTGLPELSRSAFAAICKIETLRKLTLDHSDLKQLSLEPLEGTAIESLSFVGCKMFDDEDGKSLLSMPNLNHVVLSSTSISGATFTRLVGKSGMRAVVAERCDLSSPQSADEVLDEVSRDLTLVSIAWAKKVEGEVLNQVAQCVTLTALNVNGCTTAGLDFFVKVLSMPKLELLLLAGTNVGDEAFARGTMKGCLKVVSLHNAPITNTALKRLCTVNREIVELDLYGTGVTDEGVAFLSELPNLRILNIACRGVSEQSGDSLAAIGDLNYLIVSDEWSMKAIESLERRLPSCLIVDIPIPIIR